MSTMKSVVMRNQQIHVQEAPLPQPGPGQVLVRSLACGICGSDLHILHHSDELFGLFQEMGVLDPSVQTAELQINLGHEFSAEIVAFGPDTRQQMAPGQRVTSIPFLLSSKGQVGIGVTPMVHGAYSEYFLLQESLMLPVPDTLPDNAVAMTEPFAVGLHAVNHGQLVAGEAALVAGCGPIGLACIAALRRQGCATIVASDPVAANRELALEMGATHAVDPLAEDEVALAASLAGDHRLVILECVGRPEMISQLIERAPEAACIVFTGVHTSEVPIKPALAMVKQLNLRFSYYYTAEEFAECLQALGNGEISWRKLCTGTVGIDGVPGAFQQLSQPNKHIKVIVEPWRNGELELPASP